MKSGQQKGRRVQRRTTEIWAESLERRLLLSRATHGAAPIRSDGLPLDPSYQPTQSRLFNPKGSRFLSKPSRGSPLDIALKFLRDNAAKLGVSAVDFANP